MSADLPDVDLDLGSAFVAATGFELTEVSGTRVTGTVDLGPDQHTPWGVVHGGVYCTVVESAASIGASAAVADRGQFAVGRQQQHRLPAADDRPAVLDVVAEPIQQGRTLQLWQVDAHPRRRRQARRPRPGAAAERAAARAA